MEERLRTEIRVLFNDIKQFEKNRTRIVKGIIKDRGTVMIEHIMDEEFQIKKKLAILTVLLKVLLNIDFNDINLWDLGKRHIHLSYFKDGDYETVLNKKYKVED